MPRASVQRIVLLGPAVVWAAAFIVAPVAMAVAMSFWAVKSFHLVHTWDLHNYDEFFTTAIYYEPLIRSLVNGLWVAAACVVISVPLAHFIHFRARRAKLALLGGVVIALWLGYLLRIFGWRILLGKDGLVNSVLMSLGLEDEPASWLMFSRFAVILAQVHLALPFAFIPIYLSMERVPRSLVDAASDLYAGAARQFTAVELPLISGGVITGAMFAFVIAFGDYIAPVLVGGPGLVTIGNVASDQFGASFNWPLGAVVGTLMTLTVIVVMAVPDVIRRLWR